MTTPEKWRRWRWRGRRGKAAGTAVAVVAAVVPAVVLAAGAGAAVVGMRPAVSAPSIPQQPTFFGGTINGSPGVALMGPFDDAMAADVNGATYDSQETALRDWLQYHVGLRIVSGDFNGDGQTDFVELPTPTVSEPYIPMFFQTPPTSAQPGVFVMGGRQEDDSAFLALAAEPGVVPVAGDFNGDGKTDIALLSGPGWTTIPIAFSTGDGFDFTDFSSPDFAGWSYAPYGARASVGDFNGDGKDDIALTGAGYFTTIPLALSNGDGTFSVSNTSSPTFEQWAMSPGAQTIVGHFDAAHPNRAGLALLGAGYFTTIPTAFSNGDGTFAIYNNSVGDFGGWAAAPGVQIVPGDGPHSFRYNGLTSIALTGGNGWTTVPMAAPDGVGGWSVTNDPAPAFAQLAAAPHVTAVAADNSILLVGGQGWRTLPRLFSIGDGTWQYDALTSVNMPLFGQEAAYNASFTTPTPTAPPPTSPTSTPTQMVTQVHTYTVQNCDDHAASAGAVFGPSKSVWVNDVTANTGFREMAVLQGFPVGELCGASSFTPQTFVFNATAGHTYELRVIDYALPPNCATDSANGCRVIDATFQGNATGQNLVATVTS